MGINNQYINKYKRTNILNKNDPNIIIKILFFVFSVVLDHRYEINNIVIGIANPIIIYFGINYI